MTASRRAIACSPFRIPVSIALLALAACGGGGSPTTPSTPPPAAGFDAVAVVFYDENANNLIDPSELVRLGDVTIDIGGRSGRSERATGRVVVQNVPSGTYTISVQRGTLPAYWEPGTLPSVTVPQEPGKDFVVPLRLPIGSNRANYYLAFGDSITEGDGSSDGDGWSRSLDRLIQLRIGNSNMIKDGVGGTTSAQGAARLSNSLRRYAPAYTLVVYGTNDWNTSACQSTVSTCFTASAMQSMIDTAKSRDSLPVISTIPPANTGYDTRVPEDRNIRNQQINEELRSLAKAANVPLAETYAAFEKAAPSGDFKDLFRDHVHPNDDGHDLIAQAFLDAIFRQVSATGSFLAIDDLPSVSFTAPGIVGGARGRRSRKEPR
ncbi:MAG: GDSL-type esterase/lipase family protein [Vicinamibacteria bacterium]